MGNQILGSDKIVRLNNFDLLGMVQSVDWSPSFNAQDIFEMGRDTKVDTSLELETSGSLEVLSIGGTAGILARTIVKRDVNGVSQGYTFDSAGAPGKNGYTFTQNDLKECQFDLVIHEKPDQTLFTRSTVLPRCFLTSISGRADASGTASETLNFGGDFVFGALNPYHDIKAVPATLDTANNRLVLTDSTITSTNYTIMYAYIGSRRVRTTNTDSIYVAFNGSNPNVTVTGLTLSGIPTETASVIVYKTSPSTTFPSVTSGMRTTSAFYVRGWQINIYIAPANVNSPTENEKWLKVQSIDWNVDMRVEAIRQILFNDAGSAVYCRLPTYPLTISANVSIYESDWAEWKAMLTKTFPGNDKYQDTYDFAPNNLKSSFAVVVEYKTKAGVTLQTWKFTDMRIDGYGNRTNIGGRAEVSWSLSGTAFTLQGYNV